MFSTFNSNEKIKFDRLSKAWWEEDGPFKQLHKMNKLRISYIKEVLSSNYKDLKGMSCLDVGCGGGILSFPLERLGAKLTAIDQSPDSIAIACSVKELKGSNISFKISTIEDLEEDSFDSVFCMEVVEHVDDIKFFLREVEKRVKNGGFIFLSTINKNIGSYFKAIVAAEYLLRFVPIGTHSWKNFVKPSQIADSLINCKLIDLRGMKLNLLKDSWGFSNDVSLNYLMTFMVTR